MVALLGKLGTFVKHEFLQVLPPTLCAAMSAFGYKQTFHGVRQRVRSYPESRRSRANVRFPTDFVCFTPGSGRSRDLP